MIDLNHCNEWQHRDPKTGLVFPWYTKPFLDDLSTWNLSDKNILEIGGGASSLWWQQVSKHVVTLESNIDYIHEIRKQARNVTMLMEYSILNFPLYNSLFPTLDFDIIIIDGIDRDNFIQAAIDWLNPGGKLIIDNWMQPSVWVATEENQALLTQLEHYVFPQPGHPDWKTAYFIKK